MLAGPRGADTVFSSSIMHQSDVASYPRIVRFDSECVLIPECFQRSRRPRMLTKSYSLPLWRKKPPSPLLDQDVASDDIPSVAAAITEDSRIVLKVPIPTFTTKASLPHSPTRGRSITVSPTSPKPLSPCIVHRSPSLASSTRVSQGAGSSLPVHHRPKVPSEVTVPLRACCPDCERLIEECLKEGEDWKEKFSRGAKRRRSQSLEDASVLSASSYQSSPTFAPSRTSTSISKFALTVDEVDKRRKSLDLGVQGNEAPLIRSMHSLTLAASSSAFDPNASPTLSPSPGTSPRSELALDLVGIAKSKPRSSPIQEEDEAQLFPLPSSRRGSRSPSLTLSPKTSPIPSPRGSPLASPIGSSAYLNATAGGSKESVASGSSSAEGKLKPSLARKSNGLLSPLPASSISAPSVPATATSNPSPSMSPASPESHSHHTFPLHIHMPHIHHSAALSEEKAASKPLASNIAPSHSPPTHASHSPTTESTSLRRRSSHSPVKTRKRSFSQKAGDALTDVLKGVSGMGGSGVVGNV